MGSRSAEEAFLYEQLEQRVRAMIEAGVLRPGERAPSLRRLSKQERVSLATAMQAYMALERKGYLESRPRSGFYVRTRPATAGVVPRPRKPRAMPQKVKLGDMVGTIFALNNQPGIVSLGIANPSPELLPVKGLVRATTQVANRHRLASLEYSLHLGAEELRRQIALRVAELGCAVSPDEVLVTTGATEALAVALHAVARPGDVIAVESPAYFLVLQLIERLGMFALEVQTDAAAGMRLEALEEALESVDVKAVIAVPNFHNPLGSLMPEENKRRLVELLAERGVALIEDDIYGDLAFEQRRPSIAKRYDRAGNVLTCSSFSKTLAPGYRVGWLLPGSYMDAARRCKQTMSSATASLPQLAIAEFLHNGNYDRFLRRVRSKYAEQVARMRAAVLEHFPEGTRVTNPKGGFVLWVELPRRVDGRALFQEALAHSVSFTPGVLFSPAGKFGNFIRLCAGLPWSEHIERAVERLGVLAGRAAGRGAYH
jgi:DNA-binding transcriptional MocR family regulator